MLLGQGNIWRGEEGWNWKLDIHPDSYLHFEVVAAHVQQGFSCHMSSIGLTPPDDFSVAFRIPYVYDLIIK
jgi:hypothetical protein